MKFFRNAVYVLFSLSLLNLAGSFYMYRHIMNKSDVVQIRIPMSKDLEELPLHAKLRDLQKTLIVETSDCKILKYP